MALKEKNCSEQIKAMMDQPANSENRLRIALTDEQLLANDNYSLCTPEMRPDNTVLWKDPAEALKKFYSSAKRSY